MADNGFSRLYKIRSRAELLEQSVKYALLCPSQSQQLTSPATVDTSHSV